MSTTRTSPSSDTCHRNARWCASSAGQSTGCQLGARRLRPSAAAAADCFSPDGQGTSTRRCSPGRSRRALSPSWWTSGPPGAGRAKPWRRNTNAPLRQPSPRHASSSSTRMLNKRYQRVGNSQHPDDAAVQRWQGSWASVRCDGSGKDPQLGRRSPHPRGLVRFNTYFKLRGVGPTSPRASSSFRMLEGISRQPQLTSCSACHSSRSSREAFLGIL